jgi:SET domain-containing protein
VHGQAIGFAPSLRSRYAAARESILQFSNPLPNSSVPQRRTRIGRSRTGLGLFAVKPFKKREYIVTYRGRLLGNAEAERLEARGSRYMFEINTRWTIDGSRRWNLARYVNHSCRPNAEAILRNHGIKYVARRRIKADEEITVDYGKDYFDSFITKSRCRCVACREKASARRSERRRKAKRRAARLVRERSKLRAKARKKLSRRASVARKR